MGWVRASRGCEEERGGEGGGEEAKRKRGIKIFSEQNAVMTKYPPGVCRAKGVSGKGGAPWQG